MKFVYPEFWVWDLAVIVFVHDIDHLLDLLVVQLTGQMSQDRLDLVRVNAALSILTEHPGQLAVTQLATVWVFYSLRPARSQQAEQKKMSYCNGSEVIKDPYCIYLLLPVRPHKAKHTTNTHDIRYFNRPCHCFMNNLFIFSWKSPCNHFLRLPPEVSK